ncbi:cytochrome P450 [Jimgerdemannia flammicorona]|nr:cytochrome P450 [Jimgerdemannia flammicorona]
MIPTILITLFIAFIGYYFSAPAKETDKLNNGKELPGPIGIPYFGNIFQIGLHQYISFSKWAQEYGPIFQIKLGVKRWVVVSDAAVAHELMVKRGTNYSARDHSFIMNEIVHPGSRGMLASSGEYWRKIRKLAHNGLAQKPVESYTPFIENESLELVRSLYNSALDPVIHFRLFTLNIILTTVYAKRFESPDDPTFLKLQSYIVDTIGFLGYDAIINLFPILRKLPLGLNKKARHLMANYFDLMKQFWDRFKEEHARGETKPCVASHVINHQDDDGLDDFDVHNMFIDVLGAGLDTTAITLSWMIALLANHPEMQARAHAELDAAIGRDRLPTLADQPNLPYIRAILRETLRYRPATGWLSIPHQSVQDDLYEGHLIPADTTVVANVYAMNMDPRRYAKPERFDPDRFLHVTESSAALANGPIGKRDHVTFGWGRRLCVGVHLAEAEGFLSLAQLLWCYRIEVEKGGVPPVVNEWQLGITMPPKPFRVKFAPRHEGVKEVIAK